MLIGETVVVALDALRANKVRSLLTMLGIVIGVGSVIAMIALGNGAQRDVRDRIAKLGTTVIWINPQRVQQGGVGTATAGKLTTHDADAIMENAPSVVGVNYQQDRPMQIVWGKRNTNVQVTGTNSNFPEVRGFKIAAGRMFNEREDHGRRKVAVMGAGALTLLNIGDPNEVIGERIRIAGRMFTVVGVLADRGVAGVADADNQILVPFTTGRFELFGTDRLQDIWVRAASEDVLPTAMGEVQVALRRSQKLRIGSPDSFTMRNQVDNLVALDETAQVFTLLLAGIAGVSLLVGGIGIMNIMLVTVTERTREIGVRKALGATRRNIRLQFLAEAVVLCLAGGALGVASGFGASIVLSRTMGWNASVDGVTVVVALAFATVTALVFGIWPAHRAAILDPIEALRYE